MTHALDRGLLPVRPIGAKEPIAAGFNSLQTRQKKMMIRRSRRPRANLTEWRLGMEEPDEYYCLVCDRPLSQHWRRRPCLDEEVSNSKKGTEESK